MYKLLDAFIPSFFLLPFLQSDLSLLLIPTDFHGRTSNQAGDDGHRQKNQDGVDSEGVG